MKSEHDTTPGRWSHGTPPTNVRLGSDTVITGDLAFKRFYSRQPDALVIGNYVIIGWNATISDTDFHPLAPAERIADAIACSPLGKGRPRPAIPKLPVIIENDVWIGPNATILKGVRVSSGSWIEAGSLVTCDVPPRTRVLGNPAQIVGEIP
jgi:acetyltransferase-like isoleucine patch superfamily enzyme